MSDVFISHVEEDKDVALEIARALNAAGYTTWCYEEDNDPGVSYLTQIGEAIEACHAVVLVISPESLGSDQVSREVEFSHDSRKRFVPVLKGISHVEFQNRRATWRVALGTASSIEIPPEGASAILPRIVRGLQGLDVKPTGPRAAEEVEAERRAREKAEQDKREREPAEAERLVRETAEAERKTQEKADLKRLKRDTESGRPSPSSEARVAQVPVAGRKLWKVLVPAALMLVAAAVGGTLYFRSRQSMTRLTDKDTIVLSDFDNKTGDSVFDDTLKQGLSVQLEQSPFLALVSDRKVNETLKLMGRPAGDRLTPEVTLEICLRTGSKAMLTGSIAGLGSQYVIGLKAVNCNTGDMLAEAQEQAASKEMVLKALNNAAVSLRGKLGESLASVEKYATPVEEATTPSLEALKAYSLGQKMQFAKGTTAALPLYKRAAELDPSFPMAYRAMSVAYGNLQEVGRAAENARKAYELREKVSERERFSIEAAYYLYATGELEKAAHVYELWQQTYPRDAMTYTSLGFISAELGNLEKALEESQEAMRRDPNAEIRYGNLADDYVALNRLDEAEAVCKQAERKQASWNSLGVRYKLAFLKGDTAQMAQLAAAAVGKPETGGGSLAGDADTEAWYGKLKNARELTRRAMDLALHNDAKETAATYQTAAALREVESGNREQARADAKAGLKLAPNRDVQAIAALALARAGDTAEAEKLAAELDRTFPLNTLVQRYWLPTIRAGVALQRKDPNQAVELLKAASMIELGQPTMVTVYLCPVYVRGEAYLMLHDGKSAAAESQKFIDHRDWWRTFPGVRWPASDWHALTPCRATPPRPAPHIRIT